MKKDDNIKWCLNIYTNKKTEENLKFLSIHLSSKADAAYYPIRISFSIGILQEDGAIYNSSYYNHTFDFVDSKCSNEYKIKIKDLKYDKNLLPDDVLTILCSVKIYNNVDPKPKIVKF